MLQATRQFNLGLGHWEQNVKYLQKKIARRKMLRRVEKQLRLKISKRRTRRCMKQLLCNPVVNVRKLDGLFIYNYLKRRSSNTKNGVSTTIHSNNDENSGNNSENTNDDGENVKSYPELIADAVGSPVNKTFPLNKTSIKLKCSYSKYRSFKTKDDESSSQESSDDRTADYVFLSDSITSPIGENRISTDLNSRGKSDIQKTKNIVTENSYILENTYEQTSISEDSSDMETRVGTSKQRRISRILDSSNNLEKHEISKPDMNSIRSQTAATQQRVKQKVIEAELKAHRKAEKRKNDRIHSSAISLKVKKQFAHHQRSINSIRISDEDDTSDSSSKKFLPKINVQYKSESSFRPSIERDSRKPRHFSSPYPDKKQKTEQNSTQKKNIDKGKTFDQSLLSYNSYSSRKDRSHTEESYKSTTQSSEIKKYEKYDDVKKSKKSKQHNESKKQKTIRSSIDSGIGRITPTPEAIDDTEIEKRDSKYDHKSEKHYPSSKHSRRSKHSSTSKPSYDDESSEKLQMRKMELLVQLGISDKKNTNKRPSLPFINDSDEENTNKPLSLPFINDSDGFETDNNLTYDNHKKDCTNPTNESPIHDKVLLENKKEIANNEVESNGNQKIHNDSASISEEVHNFFNVVGYSSSSDENDDNSKSMANKSSVDASGVKAKSIKTNLVENITDIKSSSNDNIGNGDESAESKDDKSIINKKNLDSKDFLTYEEILKFSQNFLSEQNSNTISESDGRKYFEIFTKLMKHPDYFKLLNRLLEQENLADLNIQKSQEKICDNDKLEFNCKSMTPPPIQKESTKTLDKDLETNSNVVESTTELTKTSAFNDREANLEKIEMQCPLITVNVHVEVPDVISSNITSTPSKSTTTLTSSTNPVQSSTIYSSVLATPTTSLITAGSQSDSHFTITNKSCSSTELASQISTPISSTVTPVTQPLPPYRNHLPPYRDSLLSNQNPSASTLSTSTIQKSPPPYSSSFSNEHCLQQNNSSGKKSDSQINKKNISISESEDYCKLMHEIIESILEIRKFFKEFHLIIEEPNYNPSSFVSHPLFISVTQIFQHMSKLRKLLDCDWESLFTEIISYSQSFEDSTKQIDLHDIGTTVHIYCCGNDVPTKLSSIYPRKETTAEPTSGYLNNTNTATGTFQSSLSSNIERVEPQGKICTVPGCTLTNCPGEPSTKSLPDPTINYNQQSYSLPAESILQQSNTSQAMPASITSIRMNQTQQNVVETSTLMNLLTSNQSNKNHGQLQASANQPSKNTPAHIPVLSSDIYYNHSQQQNIYPSPVLPSKVNTDQQLCNQPRSLINQESNSQTGSSKPWQSSMMSTSVELSNINNQQYYDYFRAYKSQQPVPSLSANNNQQFYNSQLNSQQFYNQQLYNPQFYNQLRASMSQHPNAVSKPVPPFNANSVRRYSNPSRNLICLQPNIASIPVSSSQTNNNQQYNIQMNSLTYQQPYTASTSVPSTNINTSQRIHNQQIYNRPITAMYQQQNSAQTQVLCSNVNNNQQHNSEISTLISQQSYIDSTQKSSQTNNNQTNTLISQKPNMVPISVSNSNVNNNQQHNNKANTLIPHQQYTGSTLRLSSNNNQQYKNQVNTSIPQQPSFVPPPISFSQTNNNQRYNNEFEAIAYKQQKISVATALPSAINHNQQCYNQPEVSAQQLKNISTSSTVKQSEKMICTIVPKKRFSINSSTSAQSHRLQQSNCGEAIQTQAQQSLGNPPTSVHSGVSYQANYSGVNQTQVQQSAINSPTSLYLSALQQGNRSKAIQAQSQQSSTNLPTSVQPGASQQVYCSTTSRAQAQQAVLNPSTSVVSDALRQDNRRKAVRAQARQPVINSPASLYSGALQQGNRNEAIQARSQQSSINLPTSVQSGVSQQVDCSSASGAQPQQAAINPSTSVISDALRQDNRSETTQVQVNQSSINPPTSTQSVILQQLCHNTASQVKIQHPVMNPQILILFNAVRTENCNEAIQTQAQLSSINPSISVNSGALQQTNYNKANETQTQQSSNKPSFLVQSDNLQNDNRNETKTKKSNTIKTKNYQPDGADKLVTVSQALESLSTAMINKDSKKSSKKKAEQPKTIMQPQTISKIIENEEVSSNNNTQNSFTKPLITNNEIDIDTTENIEIKPDLDDNDNSNSSQQVPVQVEPRDDLILIEIKKESTFSKKNNQLNHVEDLHGMDFELGFLNDTENDKDSQESIKAIKPSTSKNVSSNKAILVKTEKSYDKVNSKMNDANKKIGSLANHDVIILDDDDDDDEKNNLDLDRVSVISSDRETLKMDQSEDDILIEEEHIRTDTYVYTRQNISEEIDCAITGGSSAFSNLIITDVASISPDDFINLKESGEQNNNLKTNNVPEEGDIKLEIDEEEYFL